MWAIILEAKENALPLTVDCEPSKDRAEANSSLEFLFLAETLPPKRSVKGSWIKKIEVSTSVS